MGISYRKLKCNHLSGFSSLLFIRTEKEPIMAKGGSHHVVPDPKGGWNVKRGGGEHASIHTDTKKEAVDKGRKISQNQKTELVQHGKDGKIQRSDSHGNDSCPTKDKNN